MPKVFRPSNRESNILSKIESFKEQVRVTAINLVKNNTLKLASSISMKLIEEALVETISKNLMEKQIVHCLKQLCSSDNFEIDYQVAPIRNLVNRPNIISLYVTAYVLETLINHKIIIDIYGTDRDIYICINNQVTSVLKILM